MDSLDADLLAHIKSLADEAAEADGAAPLDEGTWLALRHGTGDEIVWDTDDAVAILLNGDLTLVVRPSERGQGKGTELLEAVLDLTGDLPLSAWSHGNHPAAAALAAGHGFERVRDLWVMRRPMTLDLDDPETPDGVEIRGFRSGDEAALLTVNAAAFATHPEQGEMDATGLAARTAEPWFDPAGLLMAWSPDGELLGFHWTKQHSPTTGEVYVVGIAPGAQGRGLGKALTLAGLHHLAGRGVDEVLLYVESDNAPAIAVYSGLGFTHAAADTHVMYRRG